MTPHDECGVFGVSTPHGKASPRSRSSDCSHCSTAARRRPASRSATEPRPAAQGRRAWWRTCSPRSRWRRSPATTPSATPATAPPERTAAQRPAVPRRDDHGPLAVAHNGNLVNAPCCAICCWPRLRPHRDQRHRGHDPDARRLGRPDLGGADRAHAAGLAGAFSLVILAPDRVHRRARPVGLPPAERRPPAPRRLRGRIRNLRAATPSAASNRRGQPRRDRHVQGNEIRRRQALPPAAMARCTFEFVYFSRPDSVWEGRNMHQVRQRLGEALAASARAWPTS